MISNKPYVIINNVNLSLPLYGFDNKLFSSSRFDRFIKHFSQNHNNKDNIGGEIVSNKGKKFVKALDNLNLKVNENGRLGIIGHNGSGKSTLLRAIAGIYPIKSGQIKVNGKVSCFISQGVGMHAEMNAFDYLRMDSIIRNLDDQETEKFIYDVINFIDLQDFAFAPLRTYSSGMQARLFATAAIFSPSEIILIDEGIGAGDQDFFNKFERQLDKFFQNSKILIIASHNKALIEKWCDSAVVMEKGKIVYNGKVRECFDFYEA